MIEVKLGNTGVQALVDTGAKLSCISEQLLQCHELFKFCKIRKCDKRAYGVNGEPVVTLGIVEVSFKINNFSFTHEFTILRGLIHPMLLGQFQDKHGRAFGPYKNKLPRRPVQNKSVVMP